MSRVRAKAATHDQSQDPISKALFSPPGTGGLEQLRSVLLAGSQADPAPESYLRSADGKSWTTHSRVLEASKLLLKYQEVLGVGSKQPGAAGRGNLLNRLCGNHSPYSITSACILPLTLILFPASVLGSPCCVHSPHSHPPRQGLKG